MLRKVFLAVLALPLVFASCKKSEDAPNEFVINGIKDVSLATVGGNILPLTISVSSGMQERVTLSVTDLPAGVSATIEPASGTPSFTTVITFNISGTTTAGTYPIHIVGTSASYTKTYDLNITLPAFNGFLVDGTSYKVTGFSTNTFGIYSLLTLVSNDNGGAYISATLTNNSWPTADGTYTYNLFRSADTAKTVDIDFSPISSSENYVNTGTDHHTATLVVSGGKYHFTFPSTEFANTTGTVKKQITMDAKEQ